MKNWTRENKAEDAHQDSDCNNHIYGVSNRSFHFFFFFAPKQLETITPMPEESLVHNEKNKKLIMPTEPTAP